MPRNGIRKWATQAIVEKPMLPNGTLQSYKRHGLLDPQAADENAVGSAGISSSKHHPIIESTGHKAGRSEADQRRLERSFKLDIQAATRK